MAMEMQQMGGMRITCYTNRIHTFWGTSELDESKRTWVHEANDCEDEEASTKLVNTGTSDMGR